MAHARLGIGAENSGKLVAKVKNEARSFALKNGMDIVIVDGPPGIGCPVVCLPLRRQFCSAGYRTYPLCPA